MVQDQSGTRYLPGAIITSENCLPKQLRSNGEGEDDGTWILRYQKRIKMAVVYFNHRMQTQSKHINKKQERAKAANISVSIKNNNALKEIYTSWAVLDSNSKSS